MRDPTHGVILSGESAYSRAAHTHDLVTVDEASNCEDMIGGGDMGNDQTIDDFLRNDPSARYVIQNAAAERRLRERDNLPKHLAATVVHYGGWRWVKIVDDNGISHIEQASAPDA